MNKKGVVVSRKAILKDTLLPRSRAKVLTSSRPIKLQLASCHIPVIPNWGAAAYKGAESCCQGCFELLQLLNLKASKGCRHAKYLHYQVRVPQTKKDWEKLPYPLAVVVFFLEKLTF